MHKTLYLYHYVNVLCYIIIFSILRHLIQYIVKYVYVCSLNVQTFLDKPAIHFDRGNLNIKMVATRFLK